MNNIIKWTFQFLILLSIDCMNMAHTSNYKMLHTFTNLWNIMLTSDCLKDGKLTLHTIAVFISQIYDHPWPGPMWGQGMEDMFIINKLKQIYLYMYKHKPGKLYGEVTKYNSQNFLWMMSDRQVKEWLFLLFCKEQFNSITCINALHIKSNFHQAFSVFINFFAFSFPTWCTYFFCLYWNVSNSAIEKQKGSYQQTN